MHKFQHLEFRLGCNERTDFICGVVIGCQLCFKSVCEISATLDLPLSSGSAWEPQRLSHKVVDHTNLQSGANKSRSPYRVKFINHVLHHWLKSSKQPKRATSAHELCVGSFMKLISMAEQLHGSLTSPSAVQSVVWSGVKNGTTGPWSSGNMLHHLANLGLVDARRMPAMWLHTAYCKIWSRDVFRVWFRLLSSSEESA